MKILRTIREAIAANFLDVEGMDKEEKFNESVCTVSAAPFHVDRKAYVLRFDRVPAWVCTQCGEPYFEERACTNLFLGFVFITSS